MADQEPAPRAKAAKGSRKSWQGRLSEDGDETTGRFVASLDVDPALGPYDILGSAAHARMLRKVGLVTPREARRILRGLESIRKDLQAGRLALPVRLEDIHMVIEKSLTDRIGPAGQKLHTGRSRNDQVALDLRLWARDAADGLQGSVRRLQGAFVALAERYGGIVMPAYTHLQRAQPVLAGHALLAYVEMLQRDADRLADARRRMDESPLGSGAVAGTSLPLDRPATARMLGFSRVSRNSIDATADRDFLVELCFACSMLCVHLSRWAEDWIVYSTTEFGFIELHDAYCTGSSMMPQKKNPDTLELIRAKSAAAVGNLVGLLTLLKGLPLAYNRDLQDDKRFAFATVQTAQAVLEVAAGIVRTARFDAERIARDLEEGFLDATSLAEYLVRKGVAFRRAHHAVGGLVAEALRSTRKLADLPLAVLRRACPKIGPDVYRHLGAANVVRRYAPDGAGGARQLRKQLAFWKRKLG